MSTIANLNSGGYYQLSNPSAGAGGGTTNPTSALLQALGGTSDNQAATSPSSAYLLDLSPQALAIANGRGNQSSAVSAATPTSSGSFILTAQQEQTIATILEKYKDAPYTQATFDDIQNDLQAAGLDPDTLSRLDEAQSFNATALFIDDLNGDFSAADAMVDPDESQKETNYMQGIISEWQQISGNTGTPGSSSSNASSSGSSTTSNAASATSGS